MENSKAEKITHFTFRAPADLADDIRKAAETERRSVSNFVVYTLEQAIRPNRPNRQARELQVA